MHAYADSIMGHAYTHFQLCRIFTCLCILGGLCMRMHLSIYTESHTHIAYV